MNNETQAKGGLVSGSGPAKMEGGQGVWTPHCPTVISVCVNSVNNVLTFTAAVNTEHVHLFQLNPGFLCGYSL